MRMHELFVLALGFLVADIASAATASSRLPLRAVSSLVMLGSDTEPRACVGVRITPTHVLTSASCATTSSLTRAQLVQTASLVTQIDDARNAIAMQLTLRAPIAIVTELNAGKNVASDGVRVLTLAQGSVADLENQGVQPSRAEQVAKHVDEDASMLLVDITAMRVTIVSGVWYLDAASCHVAPGSGACVRSLGSLDRTVDATRETWNFLIQAGAEQDIDSDSVKLLGVGAKSESGERDGVLAFTSLPASAIDSSSSTSTSANGSSSSTVDAEVRVLGPPVTRIDDSLGFIAGLRAKKHGANVCTGSLVAPRFVLTAAHCSERHKLLWVAIGALTSSGKPSNGELIPVRRRLRHPRFETKVYVYDVMLVELEYASEQQPIALVETAQQEAAAKRATVFGYGAIGIDGTDASETLRSVELPVLSNSACSKKLGGKLDGSLLCAGGEGGADACFGDSGGPLIVHPGTKKQRVLAIVSTGDGCGHKGRYGRYVRTTAVLRFVRETVNAGESPTPPPSPMRPASLPITQPPMRRTTRETAPRSSQRARVGAAS